MKIFSEEGIIFPLENMYDLPEKVLQCAASPEMELIISNTTEAGIRFVKDEISFSPPLSFPVSCLLFSMNATAFLKGPTNAVW
ncbi:MAG: hypothetical protein ABIN89_04705 [Chitinophagaceae bacterium]